MAKRTYFLLLFLLILLNSCITKTDKNIIVSPIHQNDFHRLTTYQEFMSFLRYVDSANTNITLDTLGALKNEYVLPVVKLSYVNENHDKLKILILAQQHGDEPSGCEAVLDLIASFANGKNIELLQNIELFIVPKVNPWGGDNNERRNVDDLDLNRDHMLLNTTEIQLVHQLYNRILPEVTIDIHEYNPYHEEWADFGYYKNADVQLGGVTNPVIDQGISKLIYNELIPAVKNDFESKGYSFLEYTLGHIYNEKGRLRHSTTHIDDGRQSFGILQTLSLIIEGKNGRDSIENIKFRTESQFAMVSSLLNYFSNNSSEVKSVVNDARNKLINNGLDEYVGVRFTHIKNDKELAYPLYSIAQQKDTIFMIGEYYPKRVITDSVLVPNGYLIPKNDILLQSWLKRHDVVVEGLIPNEDARIYGYTVLDKKKSQSFEGWDFWDVEVSESKVQVDLSEYIYVPLSQLSANKILLAFEPRSMLALFNEIEYGYLIQNNNYPIVKVVL
jgi:hypothetical protein